MAYSATVVNGTKGPARNAENRQPASSRVSIRVRPLGSEEKFGGGVGKTQALCRQPKAVGTELAQALFAELPHVVGPFIPQVVAGGGLKDIEWPACNHAQAERGGLTGAGEGR